MDTTYQIPGDTTQLFATNSGSAIRSYVLANQFNQPVILQDSLGIVIDTVVPGQTSIQNGNWQSLVAFTATAVTYGQATLAVSDKQNNQAGSQSANPTGPASYNYLDFSVTTGDIINVPLGFTARTAMIDNPGGRWLKLPDAGITIPPYWSGSIVQLPFGPTVANIITTTAPPAGQSNTGSGNAATIRFYDGNVAPQVGGSIIVQSQPIGKSLSASLFSQPPVSEAVYSFSFDPLLTDGQEYYWYSTFFSIGPGSGSMTTDVKGLASIQFDVVPVAQSILFDTIPATHETIPNNPPFVFTYHTNKKFAITVQTITGNFAIAAFSIFVQVNVSPVL